MKRKTFIKQAMAAGLKRNTAALAAQEARQRGEPYFFAIGRLLNYYAMLEYEVRKAVIKALLTGKPVTITDTAAALWYPFLSEKPEAICGGVAK